MRRDPRPSSVMTALVRIPMVRCSWMERGGARLERHLAAEARYGAGMLRRSGGLRRRLLDEMLARLPSQQVLSWCRSPALGFSQVGDHS